MGPPPPIPEGIYTLPLMASTGVTGLGGSGKTIIGLTVAVAVGYHQVRNFYHKVFLVLM
jgi:hypothetical protein